MIVNENPRRTEHVISGSGPLSYTFGILDANDLRVIQDGVVLDPVQYQVTGVGQDGGGTVILATNPNIGARIVILGDRPYRQTSTYTVEAFPPQRLQNDFNNAIILIQQVLEVLNRTPRLSESSLLDINPLDEPTAVDQFLRVVNINPLTLGWGTLAVLQGAVGIPLSPANGGTGGVYNSSADILQGLGAARWGTISLNPVTGTIPLPSPLGANRVAVGAGPINTITNLGVTPGTEIFLDYVVGGNVITDSVILQMQGRSNYTTTVGDVSRFYYNGIFWEEVERVPAPNLSNAPKFLRGDGIYQTIAAQLGAGVGKGLVVSNNATDPVNDVSIAPGDAFSDEADPTQRIQLYSPNVFVKQLDADWAAGSGNGGRVLGQTLANGTWHIFMFRRIGGAIDFCFTNNLVFVTPDGGTNRCHIMSIRREGGSIVAFKQTGDWVAWNSPTIDFDGAGLLGTAAQLIPLRCPLGMKTMVRYTVQLRTTSIANVAYFSDPSTADLAAALDVAPLYNVGLVNASHLTTVRQLDTMSDINSQVRGRLLASDAGTRLRLVTEGYFHPRGKQ